jgi:hypothetical protein
VAETEGSKLAPFPSSSPEETETKMVLPSRMSRTKMSPCPFVSPGTRFEAKEWNATYRPSAEIEGS